MNDAHFNTLDLNLLRVFQALLEEQSATRAGERLGLTQSAVSAARRDVDAGRLPASVPEFVPGNTLALPRPGQARITRGEAVRALNALLERCAARRAGKGK